ncbi:MAG: ATP-dependent DNA helicase UvrD2, partial [Acidimicrobiia bacterium]|nr:ATP-dependent DNA helicase UvrD2 [Acidimicrobiia bacterium]
LEDPEKLDSFLTRLHRAWVDREPITIIWDIADDAVAAAEVSDAAPWTLDARFLFPLERLRFLAFTNNYDARDGEPRWWWAHKAARRVDAREGGPADVILTGGIPAWIDGGPRQPVEGVDEVVVHGESIDAGFATPVPGHTTPNDPDLAADQLAGVCHLAGPARVIAPAGSGKTRTLAARLRHLVTDRDIEPFSITAVAYNTRAADELRQRLGADRATVRTIHSLGWAILSDARPDLGLIDEPAVRNILATLVSVPKRANTDPMGPYLEALDEVRSGLTDPELVEGERDDVPGFAFAFEDYRKALYSRGRVDHGEQVYGAIEVLLTNPDLRGRWQMRCRHMLVDEFQDLTPAYLLLIRLVASPQLQVFGVGDDDQVIYGYAGADPSFLIDYDTYFPGAGLHALETNYRCPPAVVDASSNLLSYNQRRIKKTIRAGAAHAIDHALDVRLSSGPDLAGVAADIIAEWLAAGVTPADIAVLTRVNSALIPVKAALVEREMPTADLLTGQALQRTTLRALFSWLRLVQHLDEMDRHDLLEAIRRPARGLTRVAREAITSRRFDLERLAAVADRLDPKQAERWVQFVDDIGAGASIAADGDAATTLAYLVDRIGLAGSARTLDAGRTNASKSSHLDDLIAVQRAAAIHPRLDDFQNWLHTVTAHHPQPDGVTLSSVHRVKGMEWPRIIVFGVDRGAMPHDLSTDTEEERRVFHVAITRAVAQTVVLADSSRPSRFIQELDGSASRTEVTPGRLRRPSRVAASSRHIFVGDGVSLSGGYTGTVVAVNGAAVSVRLDTGAELIVPATDVRAVTGSASGPVDEALVAALKEWRRETSKRLGVPAYVILHDATIDAIAASKPATERALVSVDGIGAAKL